MGILARDLGNLAEAEALHRRALAIAEKALGPAHPDVASILNSLARLYMGGRGRIDEGIALLERALAICQRHLRRGCTPRPRRPSSAWATSSARRADGRAPSVW
jgi:tetratricopeptide (TPR) repeat protein